METKKCTECGIEKSLEFFAKNKRTADGLQIHCRDCNRIYKAEYYERNKDKISARSKEKYTKNRSKILGKASEYAKNNKENKRAYDRIRRLDDKIREESRIRCSDWRRDNKERNKLNKNRWKMEQVRSNPVFKLRESLRKVVRRIFVNKRKDQHTEEILGVTFEEAVEYIKTLYYNRGNGESMDWTKFKKGHIEIDHIIPLSSAKNQAEALTLSRIENLQPLWHEDNRDKGARLDWTHPLRRGIAQSNGILASHPLSLASFLLPLKQITGFNSISGLTKSS